MGRIWVVQPQQGFSRSQRSHLILNKIFIDVGEWNPGTTVPGNGISSEFNDDLTGFHVSIGYVCKIKAIIIIHIYIYIHLFVYICIIYIHIYDTLW